MAAGPTTRTWATGGSPPLPLSLEVCVLPTDLTTGTFSRTHSSESKVLLRPPGLILWLSSIEASRNFEDSGRQLQRSTGFMATETGLVCKFPCHLPVKRGLLISSVSPCPPCMGASSDFTWGSPKTVNQHLLPVLYGLVSQRQCRFGR